jgi:hypothetical protein
VKIAPPIIAYETTRGAEKVFDPIVHPNLVGADEDDLASSFDRSRQVLILAFPESFDPGRNLQIGSGVPRDS